MHSLQQAKINMRSQQLRPNEIRSDAVLKLFDDIPRDHFVPEPYTSFAYSDMRIPLMHNQCMLTPLEEATIIQALDIQKHHSVLEIGTGSGYLTALLAHQAKHVLSVEYYEDLTRYAQNKLAHFNFDNITLATGDGLHGWLEKAPYDRIILSGTMAELDKSFHPQLLKNGKIFAFIGKNPAAKATLFTLNTDDSWQKHVFSETSLTPLMNRFNSPSFQF